MKQMNQLGATSTRLFLVEYSEMFPPFPEKQLIAFACDFYAISST